MDDIPSLCYCKFLFLIPLMAQEGSFSPQSCWSCSSRLQHTQTASVSSSEVTDEATAPQTGSRSLESQAVSACWVIYPSASSPGREWWVRIWLDPEGFCIFCFVQIRPLKRWWQFSTIFEYMKWKCKVLSLTSQAYEIPGGYSSDYLLHPICQDK